MDENRARRVTDELRARGIAAHLLNSGVDAYSVQVPAPGTPLSSEGGLYRRVADGFRYDSE